MHIVQFESKPCKTGKDFIINPTCLHDLILQVKYDRSELFPDWIAAQHELLNQTMHAETYILSPKLSIND